MGNFGSGVRASFFKPTPIIYLVFEKYDIFIYLIEQNVYIFIYCSLFITSLLSVNKVYKYILQFLFLRWIPEQKYEYFQTGMSENGTIYITMMKKWVSYILFLRKRGLIIYLAALKRGLFGPHICTMSYIGSSCEARWCLKKLPRPHWRIFWIRACVLANVYKEGNNWLLGHLEQNITKIW